MNNAKLGAKDIYNFINPSDLKDISVIEAAYRKKHPEVSKKPMAKSYFALHLILKGEGKLITPNGEYPLKKNDIFVRFPGEVITYYDYDETPFRYIFVTFTGATVISYFKRVGITYTNRIFKTSDELTRLFPPARLEVVRISGSERHVRRRVHAPHLRGSGAAVGIAAQSQIRRQGILRPQRHQFHTASPRRQRAERRLCGAVSQSEHRLFPARVPGRHGHGVFQIHRRQTDEPRHFPDGRRRTVHTGRSARLWIRRTLPILPNPSATPTIRALPNT